MVEERDGSWKRFVRRKKRVSCVFIKDYEYTNKRFLLYFLNMLGFILITNFHLTSLLAPLHGHLALETFLFNECCILLTHYHLCWQYEDH